MFREDYHDTDEQFDSCEFDAEMASECDAGPGRCDMCDEHSHNLEWVDNIDKFCESCVEANLDADERNPERAFSTPMNEPASHPW